MDSFISTFGIGKEYQWNLPQWHSAILTTQSMQSYASCNQPDFEVTLVLSFLTSWSRCELVHVPFTLKILHIAKFLLHGKQLLYKFLLKVSWGLLCLLQSFDAPDVIHSYQTMLCGNSVQSTTFGYKTD